MRKSLIYAMTLSLLMLASCKEKEEKKDIIVPAPIEEVKKGPQKMSETKQEYDVEWRGKNYTIHIVRSVDETQPLVTDDAGQEYYDNTITLKVLRSDSTVFYDRTYRKGDFSRHLAGTQMEKSGVLLGIVYDKIEDGKLVFATSVGSPDVLSDVFVPMKLTLDGGGNISIAPDDRYDVDEDNSSASDNEGV